MRLFIFAFLTLIKAYNIILKTFKKRDVYMKNKKKVILPALKCAFPHTIPILAGFLFLGITFGILMNVSGFSAVYPLVMSIVIFGGSIEFVAVSMLLAPFAPFEVLATTIMIQARHLFYGISMLDRFKNMGIKKFYLIFGMCDETFSINYSTEIPEGIDKGWFYFFVTLLNHFYWVCGSVIGGLLGNLITFDTKGLDFVMTSMFVVILLDDVLKSQNHLNELVGLFASVACLLIFGADNFLIPTMVCILVLLAALKKPIEKKAQVISK